MFPYIFSNKIIIIYMEVLLSEDEFITYQNLPIKIYSKMIDFGNNKKIKMSNYNLKEHIFNHFIINKGKGVFYENRLLEKIKSMDICGTYIDCGANIGNHSVYFLNFTKCNKLISIEGHDKIFDLLKLNIQNNNFENKETLLINKLIGNKNDFTSFINLTNENNCGVGYVNDKIGIKKEMITIDSLNLDEVALIKLDVENYEFQVLEGAKETILKFKPVIIIELHTKNPFHKEIINFFKEIKYTTNGINYANSITLIYKYNE